MTNATDETIDRAIPDVNRVDQEQVRSHPDEGRPRSEPSSFKSMTTAMASRTRPTSFQ